VKEYDFTLASTSLSTAEDQRFTFVLTHTAAAPPFYVNETQVAFDAVTGGT
jgi:hypothetical protein